MQEWAEKEIRLNIWRTFLAKPHAQGALYWQEGFIDGSFSSEMFTEGMVDLIEAGVVTNRLKAVSRYKCVASFCGGSQRMHD